MDNTGWSLRQTAILGLSMAPTSTIRLIWHRNPDPSDTFPHKVAKHLQLPPPPTREQKKDTFREAKGKGRRILAGSLEKSGPAFRNPKPEQLSRQILTGREVYNCITQETFERQVRTFRLKPCNSLSPRFLSLSWPLLQPSTSANCVIWSPTFILLTSQEENTNTAMLPNSNFSV